MSGRKVKLVKIVVEDVYCESSHDFMLYDIDARIIETWAAGQPEVLITNEVPQTPCRVTHFRKQTPRETLDTYLAIHPDVQEELAMFKVPDMVEGIKEKYDNLLSNKDKVIWNCKQRIQIQDNMIVRVTNATLWERIKWVFKGVSLC